MERLEWGLGLNPAVILETIIPLPQRLWQNWLQLFIFLALCGILNSKKSTCHSSYSQVFAEWLSKWVQYMGIGGPIFSKEHAGDGQKSWDTGGHQAHGRDNKHLYWLKQAPNGSFCLLAFQQGVFLMKGWVRQGLISVCGEGRRGSLLLDFPPELSWTVCTCYLLTVYVACPFTPWKEVQVLM